MSSSYTKFTLIIFLYTTPVMTYKVFVIKINKPQKHYLCYLISEEYLAKHNLIKNSLDDQASFTNYCLNCDKQLFHKFDMPSDESYWSEWIKHQDLDWYCACDNPILFKEDGINIIKVNDVFVYTEENDTSLILKRKNGCNFIE